MCYSTADLEGQYKSKSALNLNEEGPRKRKQKSPCVYSTRGLVMPAKKRQNDPATGKKNKKEKRGELAVINSDLRDEAVQKGMRDAWQSKESYTNGMLVHPRDTVFYRVTVSRKEQNLFPFRDESNWSVYLSRV